MLEDRHRLGGVSEINESPAEVRRRINEIRVNLQDLAPLDDRRLGESDRILVTAMARDRQAGARYSEDGAQLLDTGGPPLLLEPVQASITFGGRDISAARAVDVHGVPTSREVARRGNTITIDGRYATYYYEVRRRAAAPATASPSATAPQPTGTPTAVVGASQIWLPYASRPD